MRLKDAWRKLLEKSENLYWKVERVDWMRSGRTLKENLKRNITKKVYEWVEHLKKVGEKYNERSARMSSAADAKAIAFTTTELNSRLLNS